MLIHQSDGLLNLKRQLSINYGMKKNEKLTHSILITYKYIQVKLLKLLFPVRAHIVLLMGNHHIMVSVNLVIHRAL